MLFKSRLFPQCTCTLRLRCAGAERALSCNPNVPTSSQRNRGEGFPTEDKSCNIYSLSKAKLTSLLGDLRDNKGRRIPRYRGDQIYSMLMEKGCEDFSQMHGLPISLRTQLASQLHFGDLAVETELLSQDGTVKRVYRLQDGQLIESVLMPYDDGRVTACISSQAGCGMGCTFCATGQMGFSRQLSATEIFEQVVRFNTALLRQSVAEKDNRDSSTVAGVVSGRRVSNVVFMGMGEPLANYNNVIESIRRINTEIGIGARHITVSTVGIAPRIRKLALEEHCQVNLAVSLHQATDRKRSALMPVNLRYPIPELLDACAYYIERTNRRVSFEWALIAGSTDTPECARELGRLLQPLRPLCHVNLIPLNPTPDFSGTASTKQSTSQFVSILLEEYGIVATPRVRRGIDIQAGCGQLKADVLRMRKKEVAVEAARKATSGVDQTHNVGVEQLE